MIIDIHIRGWHFSFSYINRKFEFYKKRYKKHSIEELQELWENIDEINITKVEL